MEKADIANLKNQIKQILNQKITVVKKAVTFVKVKLRSQTKFLLSNVA